MDRSMSRFISNSTEIEPGGSVVPDEVTLRMPSISMIASSNGIQRPADSTISGAAPGRMERNTDDGKVDIRQLADPETLKRDAAE